MIHQLSSNLKALARTTIHDCTFEKNVRYFDTEERMRVLLPSGDEKYYSFWVRDAAMMAESGLIKNADLKRYIEIIALRGQNGPEELQLANGLTVPPHAVADHINYDARPVYYPGTYCSGNDQGDGTFGFFPPFCDNFYFIIMAGQYVRQSGDYAILKKSYHGVPLLERLTHAFTCYQIDSATGLCVSDPSKPTVDWGFVDTVKKTGKLLMASLLRYNAGMVLTQLCDALGLEEEKAQYASEAVKIKESILDTFYDEKTGWFYSATGIGHQYDVWATAYGVFSGITQEKKTLEALHGAYKDRTAVVDGYVRHILVGEDHAPDSAWESSITEMNTYQNGAYWATPTGWYAYALYKYDGSTGILSDFLEHTQKYAHQGAPFEWIDAASENFSGLKYGTSGVLPYIGIEKIENEKADLIV